MKCFEAGHVRARRPLLAALWVGIALHGGCAAIGFDPLEESSNPLPQAGDGGGGTGGSGAVSGGQGGTGGVSGQGGQGGMQMMDAGTGTGGTMIVPPTGGTGGTGGTAGMPVVTQCTGKSNFADCDDELYCTRGDYCFAEVCVGEARICGDDCNAGSCDEVGNECVLTPRPNDTECGWADAFQCMNGVCSSPIIECTEGGQCTPSCTNRQCDIECPNANSCDSTCADNAQCVADCQGTGDCQLECRDSRCTALCQGSGTCQVACTGPTTQCTVECTDASGCEKIDCLDGASCVLQCDEAESCGFRECWMGEQQHCGDGEVVCNAECGD